MAGLVAAASLLVSATVLAAPAATERAAAARSWLGSIRPAGDLQSRLEDALASLRSEDARLRSSGARVAVLDLTRGDHPELAHVRGNDPVYPASVVKFVYLMAAYAWREQGRLAIDADLEVELEAMIHHSSNAATQKVFRRLTATEAGPELDGSEYASFRERRLAIDRWLASLGIDGLHAASPTYDGGGDLFGRDRQFLRDRTVAGGLAAAGSEYSNRNAMTAAATVRLLGLLATDRALAASDSREVRETMKRDVAEQPYLAARIAGGAAAIAGATVWSKSGTWGPIFADAGIVRAPDGRQFAIAVFTDSTPAYRGDAIARLTNRIATHLFRISGGTT